jgi:hypothetical protein
MTTDSGNISHDSSAEETAMKPHGPIYLARLERIAGEPHMKEFAEIANAIAWLLGDGLKAIGGKALRADIYLKDALIWSKDRPMTAVREEAEKDELRRSMIRPAKRL